MSGGRPLGTKNLTGHAAGGARAGSGRKKRARTGNPTIGTPPEVTAHRHAPSGSTERGPNRPICGMWNISSFFSIAYIDIPVCFIYSAHKQAIGPPEKIPPMFCEWLILTSGSFNYLSMTNRSKTGVCTILNFTLSFLPILSSAQSNKCAHSESPDPSTSGGPEIGSGNHSKLPGMVS